MWSEGPQTFCYRRPILWVGLSHLLRFRHRTLLSCFRSVHFLHFPTHVCCTRVIIGLNGSHYSWRGRLFVHYYFYISIRFLIRCLPFDGASWPHGTALVISAPRAGVLSFRLYASATRQRRVRSRVDVGHTSRVRFNGAAGVRSSRFRSVRLAWRGSTARL